MTEVNLLPTDFVRDFRASVQKNWAGFKEVVSLELGSPGGSIDKQRYQAIRGILKEAVEKDPAAVFKQLRPFITATTPFESLNGKLYCILFEQYIEAIIFRKDNHIISPYGDLQPAPKLIDELRATFAAEISLRGEHGGVLFWKGITDHLEENKSSAENYLKAAAEYDAHEYHLAHYLAGASTVCKRQNTGMIFRSSLQAEFPLNFKVRNSSGDEELVIFSCADEKYYQALSDIFLGSIDAIGRKICVHLHVAAHDPDSIDVSHLTQFKNIRVDVSFSRIGDIKDRSWFTVLRWLLMPSLLNEYNKLLITSDFDVEYLPEQFDAYLENLTNYDVGLNINPFPRNRFPWTSINANQLACNATPAAKAFAAELRNMTFDYFDPLRTDQWWIDQNILYCCYEDLRSSRMSLKVYNNFETPVKSTIKNKKTLVEQSYVAKAV